MTATHPRFLAAATLLLLGGCGASLGPAAPAPSRSMAHSIVPLPVSVTLNAGEPFRLDAASSIVIGNIAEVARTGEMLAAPLRAATGYPMPGWNHLGVNYYRSPQVPW